MRLLDFFIDVSVRSAEAVRGLAAIDRKAMGTRARLNQVGTAAVNLGTNMTSLGRSMVRVGGAATLFATTPILLFLNHASRAAREADTAMAIVEQRIRTMGSAAGFTAQQLSGMAGGLMTQSLFDDDQIMQELTANLLTYGNVQGQIFADAQQAILDLAAAKGADLQSTTDAVGKALSSARGAAALSRTDTLLPADIDRVKALYEQNRVLEAQQYIIQAINRQYGGSARVQRQNNPEAAAALDAAQATEKIGASVNRLKARLFPILNRFLNWFNSLSDAQLDWAAKIAITVAAVGPLATIFGGLFSILGPVVTIFGRAALFMGRFTSAARLGIAIGIRLRRAMLFLTGPVRLLIRLVPMLGRALMGLALNPVGIALLAIAGIAYLIYENWDQIAPLWDQLSKAFTDLWAEIEPSLTELKTALVEMWNGPVGDAIRSVGSFIAGAFLTYFSVTFRIIVEVIKFAIFYITQLVTFITGMVRIVKALFAGDFSGAWEAVKAMVSSFVDNAITYLSGLAPGAVAAFSAVYNAAKTWLVDKFNQVARVFRDNLTSLLLMLPGGGLIAGAVTIARATSPATRAGSPAASGRNGLRSGRVANDNRTINNGGHTVNFPSVRDGPAAARAFDAHLNRRNNGAILYQQR